MEVITVNGLPLPENRRLSNGADSSKRFEVAQW